MKSHSLFPPLMRNTSNVIMLFACSLFVQCSDHRDQDFQTPASHTLLVYIAGDNSLSDEADRNILSMERGLLDSKEPLNLLVFKDSQDRTQTPALFQLRRNSRNEIDTLYIARYEGAINATSPEIMRSIVEEAFSLYQTPLNGLVLWSHAMSWIPSPSFTPEVVSSEIGMPTSTKTTPQKAPAHFGQDNDEYMELWELRSVLEQVPATDYILVDACHFASAETAYELKNVTRYLLAAPTEIMGTGFPYQTVLPILARMQASTIESTLIETAQAFTAAYRDNGTITLIDMAGIENLANLYASFRSRQSEILADMEANPASWHSRLQRYGRRRTGALYYFYDFDDVVRQMNTSTANGEADRIAAEIFNALNSTVRYTYHSEDFSDGRENLHIDRSCGLTLSLPELFQLSGNRKSLQAAYPLTAWGARMLSEITHIEIEE